MNKKTLFSDLGLISYKNALEIQYQHQQNLIKRKLDIRDGLISADDVPSENHLIFCSHKPVYTLGRSGALSNLLFDQKQLNEKGIEFFKSSRGGDITYHGPGQIVGYPVFDLDNFYHDVHKYVRDVEQVVIYTLEEFGITTTRIPGLTGVWIKGDGDRKDRKICAIGIHISRWVTLHGFALNVNTDLSYFNGIVPCGIDDANKDVTSMEKELGKKIDMDNVKKVLKKHFKNVFNLDYI